ncbi:hypothetical protein J6590_023485 [Homalodisca vitripennis]|nr:hypothetical protein J6590_023485 [Homalodisca vitripennis]
MAPSFYRPYLLAVSVSVPAAIIVFVAVRYCLSASPEPPTLVERRGSRAVSTLQFVAVFARHGNRGPYGNFPSYPYPLNDTRTWPYGRLQISRRGRTQMFNLGTKFRSLYNGFLSLNYKSEEFKAYSTLTDRTIMSAQLLLAGLYPSHGDQLWNKKILWDPVPVFPTYLDNLQVH